MLNVENLSFRYQHFNIFSDISFSLESGGLLVVTGPNGCGKSTLLSVLAGMRKPSGGTIKFEDEARNPAYLGAENNHLFVKRDAMANLKIWDDLANKARTSADYHEELKKWNLNHPYFRENFPVEKFSTGMKRKLALARLCLSGKKLWLLDEPLFGLDTQAIALFGASLKSHIEDGGSAVVISHDLRALQDLPAKTFSFYKNEEAP